MADPIAVIVPHETVNDESVKLLRLFVKEGDSVTEKQPIAEVETSKAVLELESPAAGIVRLVTTVGQEVAIGKPICFITKSADTPLPAVERVATPAARAAAPGKQPATAVATAVSLPAAPSPAAGGNHQPALRFSPLARRMADEAGLTLADFSGVRIVRSADVKARIAGTPLPSLAPAPEPTRTASRNHVTEAAVFAAGVAVRWDALPRRKQVEIRQIAAGMARVLPSSVTVTAPTRGLRAAVASVNVPGLTSSSVVIFEAARLLRKYPQFNAAYDDGKIGYYESVNIGMAIDDGSGLMVPVIRDADRKSLLDIAAESRGLLERYIEKSLAVGDFVGTTFTISDLSSENAFAFSPLISQGQSAILGVGSEFFPPGSPAGMFNLTLVFDHQLADGRVAAAFLNDLSQRLTAYEASRATGNVTEMRFCSFCNRDADSIRKLNGYLVRSEVPEGFVCSTCLGGF